MILIDVARDPWPLWNASQPRDTGSWRVALADWQPGQWIAPVLLQIPNEHNPANVLAQAPTHIAGLALEFPAWTDGRAYSQAALWRRMAPRDSLLAATGDVVLDMLPWLQQLGFDLVYLRADQSPTRAHEVIDLAPVVPSRGWQRVAQHVIGEGG